VKKIDWTRIVCLEAKMTNKANSCFRACGRSVSILLRVHCCGRLIAAVNLGLVCGVENIDIGEHNEKMETSSA